jgi:hypothetical protein
VNERRWSLTVLPLTLAVVRLDAAAAVPAWATLPPGSELHSLTRTSQELSIVCPAAGIPAGVDAERDWRALRVEGPLDFSEVGVLASLSASLAGAGVSIFALSTYDTDYILVRVASLGAAVEALREAGHTVVE